jgi:predicted transcriptional regulator
LALSIRQPFAELILRGVKTVEFRTFATRIIGQRFHIYAAKRPWAGGRGQGPRQAAQRIWSDDLAVPGRDPGTAPPPWMLELAEMLILDQLPRGVIVGSAVIERVTQAGEMYHWHLADVRRARKLRKPTGHPQPVWFNPF